jgi:hypothetical protein
MGTLWTLSAYDVAGAPLSGLSPSWSVYMNVTTGLAQTPPPITEIASSGIYGSQVDPAATGLVDLGTSSVTRYNLLLPVAPALIVIPAFSEATGSPVPGLFLSWNACFDASTDIPVSSLPTFAELGGGLYRVDGMAASVVGRVDLGSGQNPRYYDIGLGADPPGTAPLPPGPSAPAPVGSAPYGTDGRTFLDLGNGPDLDPQLLIVAEPRIVMAESLARRLTTIRGQLLYAPNDGWDLRQLVNAALTSGDVESLQGTIQQECLKDPRIQTAIARVAVTGSTVTITISAIGTSGPFGIVFSLASVSGSVVVTDLTFS